MKPFDNLVTMDVVFSVRRLFTEMMALLASRIAKCLDFKLFIYLLTSLTFSNTKAITVSTLWNMLSQGSSLLFKSR